jgi:uncharacterized protein (DUF58 family)
MKISEQLSNDYISRIGHFPLKAKLILMGAMTGVHGSPFHGYSSEFSQFRNYAPGDDLKHFDWKSFAKNERPLIRQYLDETNTNIYLLLDSSASMAFRGSGIFSKLEYAAILSASLALLAYRQRDCVSLAAGADSPRIITQPRNSAAALKQVFECLENLQPGGKTDLKNLIQLTVPFVKPGSMSFILTDLWQETDAVTSGIKSLCHKSRAASLLNVLSPEETGFYREPALELEDMENGRKIKVSAVELKDDYLKSLGDHNDKIRAECHRLKINYVQIFTDDPLPVSLRKILKPGAS